MTAFLAPGVVSEIRWIAVIQLVIGRLMQPLSDGRQMEALGAKLVEELPDDARVVVCRYPFQNWQHQSSVGSGLEQTWAYDIRNVRSSLRNGSRTTTNDSFERFV